MSEYLQSEMFRLICGKELGEGSSRKVFEHAHNRKLVIKTESNVKSFCNIVEWETWLFAKQTKLKKWFAPCVDISPCGGVLLQKKIVPVDISRLPLEVPECFSDLKVENWGLYKGNIVCCDYGQMVLSIPHKLVKANWS